MTNFNTSTTAVNGIAPGAPVTGGMWYGFVAQNGRTTLQKPKYDIVMPRVGFSWQLRNNLVLRGGIGVYTSTWSEDTYGSGTHRAAWDDPFADQLAGGFFSDTRLAQEEAFVRPRYSGYVALQTDGGQALQEYLRDGRSLEATLEKLDALYRESRARGGRDFQTN